MGRWGWFREGGLVGGWGVGEAGIRPLDPFRQTMTGMKITQLGQSIHVVVQSSKLFYIILTVASDGHDRCKAGLEEYTEGSVFYWPCTSRFGCPVGGRLSFLLFSFFLLFVFSVPRPPPQD